MSAPPIGFTSKIPRSRDNIINRINIFVSKSTPTKYIARDKVTSTSIVLTEFWNGNFIGWPGRMSCNLPKAIMLPENVMSPIIDPNIIDITIVIGMVDSSAEL